MYLVIICLLTICRGKKLILVTMNVRLSYIKYGYILVVNPQSQDTACRLLIITVIINEIFAILHISEIYMSEVR